MQRQRTGERKEMKMSNSENSPLMGDRFLSTDNGLTVAWALDREETKKALERR